MATRSPLVIGRTNVNRVVLGVGEQALGQGDVVPPAASARLAIADRAVGAIPAAGRVESLQPVDLAVAGGPDEAEAAAVAQHPRDLGRGLLRVQPVPRRRDEEAVGAGIRQRIDSPRPRVTRTPGERARSTSAILSSGSTAMTCGTLRARGPRQRRCPPPGRRRPDTPGGPASRWRPRVAAGGAGRDRLPLPRTTSNAPRGSPTPRTAHPSRCPHPRRRPCARPRPPPPAGGCAPARWNNPSRQDAPARRTRRPRPDAGPGGPGRTAPRPGSARPSPPGGSDGRPVAERRWGSSAS